MFRVISCCVVLGVCVACVESVWMCCVACLFVCCISRSMLRVVVLRWRVSCYALRVVRLRGEELYLALLIQCAHAMLRV